MIINIPITVPDEILENTIATDYERKITERLTEEVRASIINQSKNLWNKSYENGLADIVYDKIGLIIKESKDEIINIAADKLAERLARTKAAKELVND